MAFGFKVKKIKFANQYSINGLFDRIKDETFSAGKPELVKYLASTVIVFPALDSKNQVQIMLGGFKKETNSFVVQKGDELSLNGAVKNMAFSDLTGGISNLGSAFGKNPKECERLVDETVKELAALNL